MTLSWLPSWLALHLWQSTLFALAATAMVVTVLRRDDARVRHAVWLAASVKFLVPLSVLVTLGGALGALRPPVGVMPEPVRVAIEQVNAGVPLAVVPRRLAADVTPTTSVLPLVAALWAMGVLALTVRWYTQWRRLQQYARLASPLTTTNGLPVRASPLMREQQCEPGLFGIVRPVILVPTGIEDRLSPAEFRAVLAHEICHAQRHDNLTGALQAVVETVFWFHPLVWWLGRRLHHERERACDEAVLAQGVDSETYAQAILSTCRFYVESRLFGVAGIGSADLEHRIDGIVAPRPRRPLPHAVRGVLASVAVVTVLGPVIVGLLGTTLRAQTGNSFTGLQTSVARKFDVASIKVNRSGDPGWRLGPPDRGTESITNLELRKIVASSFRIQDKMVIGPDWTDTIRYDVQAKGSSTASNPEVWEMMRALLAERFHLQYHIEAREIPAYVLVVGRDGHKLVKGESGACAEAIAQGMATCDALQFLPFGMGIRNMPLNALAAGLARRLQDRPVVDRTGLEGRWDATVLWRDDTVAPERLADVPADMRPPDVNMFEAFEQQAGLKIEARRERIDVLVIDHIEPADEN